MIVGMAGRGEVSGESSRRLKMTVARIASEGLMVADLVAVPVGRWSRGIEEQLMRDKHVNEPEI